jgi:hypothetical protein
MPERAISLKIMVFIIVITWFSSLITTLAIVYNSANILPITDDKIASNAIITSKLADGTVTSAKILDGTLIAVDMADGSITTIKVADGAITVNKIVDGAVASYKIRDEAVTTQKIADGAIITLKMADNSVTSAKILDGTVTAVDLATNAVTTITIDDGAVTTSKIADEAVTNVKLAPQAIPFNCTYRITPLTKSTYTWENMTGTSVTITLERNSTLLIMFSAEAYVSTADNYIEYQAIVNTDPALPGAVWLQPSINVTSGFSYNFYKPSVSAGVYKVYMQWRVWVYPNGGFGGTQDRTLIVTALPA